MALFNKGYGDSKAIGVFGALSFLTGALVLATAMTGIRLLLALAYDRGFRSALLSDGSARPSDSHDGHTSANSAGLRRRSMCTIL